MAYCLGLCFNCFLCAFPLHLPLVAKQVGLTDIFTSSAWSFPSTKRIQSSVFRRQPGIVEGSHHTRVESSANGMTNSASVIAVVMATSFLVVAVWSKKVAKVKWGGVGGMLFLCLFVFMSLCLNVLMSLCLYVFMSLCLYVFNNFWQCLTTFGNYWQLLSTIGHH